MRDVRASHADVSCITSIIACHMCHAYTRQVWTRWSEGEGRETCDARLRVALAVNVLRQLINVERLLVRTAQMAQMAAELLHRVHVQQAASDDLVWW
eukprot:scaffold52537_cov58-Phaeocystis_antarctica.AAC.6